MINTLTTPNPPVKGNGNDSGKGKDVPGRESLDRQGKQVPHLQPGERGVRHQHSEDQGNHRHDADHLRAPETEYIKGVVNLRGIKILLDITRVLSSEDAMLLAEAA
jgi:hypothetical protein